MTAPTRPPFPNHTSVHNEQIEQRRIGLTIGLTAAVEWLQQNGHSAAAQALAEEMFDDPAAVLGAEAQLQPQQARR